jgi:hypothetical protein
VALLEAIFLTHIEGPLNHVWTHVQFLHFIRCDDMSDLFELKGVRAKGLVDVCPMQGRGELPGVPLFILFCWIVIVFLMRHKGLLHPLDS